MELCSRFTAKRKKKKSNFRATDRSQCHSHDDRGEDKVEGGDLKHVAVGVWVYVDIFILWGHAQGFDTTISPISMLRGRWSQKCAQVNTSHSQAMTDCVNVLTFSLPALETWSWTPIMAQALSLTLFWPRTVNTAIKTIRYINLTLSYLYRDKKTSINCILTWLHVKSSLRLQT